MRKKLYYKVGKGKNILFLGLLFLFGGGALLLKPVFETIDDETLRSIISGTFGEAPDGHAIYMYYPLTGILQFLYQYVSREIPWYGLFLFGVFFFSTYIVLKNLLCYCFKNRREKIITICISIVFLIIIINFFLLQQYTVIAGILCATAVFLGVVGGNRISIFLLMTIAFMLRSDVFLMGSPFVMAAILWKSCPMKKENLLKKVNSSILPVAVFLIGIFLIGNMINSFQYSDKKYQEYKEYNKVLTSLYDYTDLPYDSQEKYKEEILAAGISSGIYDIVNSHNLMLDENLDEKLVSRFVTIVHQSSQFVPSKTIGGVLNNLIHTFQKKSFMVQTLVTVLIYVLLVIIMARGRQWERLLITVFTFLGKWTIMFYFFYIGRIVERVYSALWIMEMLFLIGVMVSLFREQMPVIKKWFFCIVYGFVLILVCSLFVRNIERLSDSQKNVQSYVNITNYCKEHPKNNYFLDIIVNWGYQSHTLKENTKNENMMLMGGWSSWHPLLKDKIEQWGGKDAGDILCSRDNAYYIKESDIDREWMQEYLSDRFGKCTFEIVDRINGGLENTFDVIKVKLLIRKNNGM